MLQSFSFSSEMLPERERKGYWREVVARQILGMDSEPLPDVPFLVEMNAIDPSGVTLAGVKLSGTNEKRTRQTLSDGVADFLLTINLYGAYKVSHRGQELTVPGGEAILQSMGELGTYARPVLGAAFGIRLPRETLSALVPQVDDLAARTIPPDNAALLLLSEYSGAVNNMNLATPSSVRQAAVSHIVELVALTLGSAFGTRVEASRRGARAAMLHRIKTYVGGNLHRCDLSLGIVADCNGLTPRTVQRLFAEEQTSFSEFVLSQRLSRVFERLRDPRHARSTVTMLAYECGFGDMSTFYKYFRRRYGASPMDVRNGMPG